MDRETSGEELRRTVSHYMRQKHPTVNDLAAVQWAIDRHARELENGFREHIRKLRKSAQCFGDT